MFLERNHLCPVFTYPEGIIKSYFRFFNEVTFNSLPRNCVLRQAEATFWHSLFYIDLIYIILFLILFTFFIVIYPLLTIQGIYTSQSLRKDWVLYKITFANFLPAYTNSNSFCVLKYQFLNTKRFGLANSTNTYLRLKIPLNENIFF